jgi:hypothetical protein
MDRIGGRLRKKEEIEEQLCHLDVIMYSLGVLFFLTVSKIEHLLIAFAK